MRLLVIEDEWKLAAALKKGLEQEGYAVDCLFDGSMGQLRLEECPADYDLVILDVMLPGVDGVTLCRNIRSQGALVPVIMLTAKDGPSDRVTGLDGGADDYLVKPFDFEELLARVRALLRRPRSSLPPSLETRDLVLDPATKRAYRAGKEVALTAKEFSLLEYFMRNPGRVLTREQILAHVWDYSFDSFSNVVDVHVRNLRRKIDRDNRHALLETVRGVGYRLKG